MSAAQIIATLTKLSLWTSKSKGRGKKAGEQGDIVLIAKTWSAKERIFFHRRWYCNEEDDEDQDDGVSAEDAEVATQLEATSSAFRATMAEGASPTTLCIYHPGADMFSPMILLVGPAKGLQPSESSSTSATGKGRKGKTAQSSAHCNGGIVVLMYGDSEQTHIEYGSI
jgi:hypothetical protein